MMMDETAMDLWRGYLNSKQKEVDELLGSKSPAERRVLRHLLLKLSDFLLEQHYAAPDMVAEVIHFLDQAYTTEAKIAAMTGGRPTEAEILMLTLGREVGRAKLPDVLLDEEQPPKKQLLN
jgi:hypothetical protein